MLVVVAVALAAQAQNLVMAGDLRSQHKKAALAMVL
jgi:hypothetical protein